MNNIKDIDILNKHIFEKILNVFQESDIDKIITDNLLCSITKIVTLYRHKLNDEILNENEYSESDDIIQDSIIAPKAQNDRIRQSYSAFLLENEHRSHNNFIEESNDFCPYKSKTPPPIDMTYRYYYDFWTSLLSSIYNLINGILYHKEIDFVKIRNNEELVKKMNEYIKIVKKFEHESDDYFLRENLNGLISILDDFMTNFLDSLIYINICNAQLNHIHYLITSIKRWNKLKKNYIDSINKRNKNYVFLKSVTQLIKKDCNKKVIKPIILMYMINYDNILSGGSGSNSNIETQLSEINGYIFDYGITINNHYLLESMKDFVDVDKYINGNTKLTKSIFSQAHPIKLLRLLKKVKCDKK
jgi:hypothetical protein